MASRRKTLTHLARQLLETCQEIELCRTEKRLNFLLKSLASETEIMRRLTKDMTPRTSAEVVQTLIIRHADKNVCNAKLNR